ncbi:MAG: hypothetical protein AB7I41_17090 [Candidatus Sericytochromatia bacterium]
MMKALGIIAARKGSKRLVNKHHIQILGKPIFEYVLQAASEASHVLEKTVVCTDDLSLEPLVKKYGFELIPRPEILSSDTAAIDDTYRYTTRLLMERDGFNPDAIIALTGNIPTRKEGQIEATLTKLASLDKATSVCTAQNLLLRPEWAKVIADPVTGQVKPFMTGDFAYRKQELPELYILDGAVIAIRRDVLFATEGLTQAHAWLGSQIHILPQEHPMYSLEVDYPQDISQAAFYLLYQQQGQKLLDYLNSVQTPSL